MHRMTIAAALAAGLLLGCKPQEPPVPAPGPEPVVQARPVGVTTSDDVLITSPPPRATQPAVAPPPAQPAGATKYVIKPGDTMINIARTHLGNAARVKEIQAMNPGVDPNKLRVGQEILIPAK